MTQIFPIDLANEAGPRLPASIRGAVISIGNFDGVHRGHAELLTRIRALAEKHSSSTAVVVLDPHPVAILRPDAAHGKLTTLPRRAELMSRFGIESLVVCQTSREFLNLSATEFFERLVVDQINAVGVVEGPNFFFGRGREGDTAKLKSLCHQHSIELEIVDETTAGEQMISSTRIREAIQSGQIEAAIELLGHPFQIAGTVTQGSARGRQIGFPTANLSMIDAIIPSPGVYSGIARIDSSEAGESDYDAAIHIGPNPTFGDDRLKVEVHLIGFEGDLYERVLQVDLVGKVRDIARFDSADALVEQLRRDVAVAQHAVAQYRRNNSSG